MKRLTLLCWLLGAAALWTLPLPASAQVSFERDQLRAADVMLAIERYNLFVGAQPAAEKPMGGRLLQRLGTNQLRHGSRILCLAYAPNGQLLAAGGGADPIRMWDTTTGQQKYTCPETWINAIVFTLRGSVFLTGGAFKTIKLWETATGKQAGQLVGHAAPIKALALSPDGSMLASAAQDGTIILWELSTSKKIIELKEHTGEITSLAFCPAIDIPVFVSGSNDRTIRVWDGDTNQLRKTINAGCGVLAVAITPDGKTVFSGGDDNLIRAWDAESGKLLKTLKGHTDMVVSLVLSRDGKTLISGGRDKAMRVWDVANLQAEPRVIPRDRGDSDALALAKDGKHIATAGLNNTIRIFETATGKELFANGAPQAALAGLAVSRDGKRLAAISSTGMIYLWDPTAARLERAWATDQPGDSANLAFTPDGQLLLTAAGHVGRAWNANDGQLVFSFKNNAPVVSLSVAPNGKTLAIGMRDGAVQLFDLGLKRETDQFAYPGQASALAFTPDSSLLAASGGSKIVIWDCAAKKERGRFECKDAPPKTVLPDVAALAFSPDRKTLAAACFDGVIRLLDFTTGKEIGQCEGHQSVPYAIAYAPDGRTLLSGSFDATVRLWEPFSGAQLAEFKGHAGPVYGVALSPDARVAYSAGADTSVMAWDATGLGTNQPKGAALNPGELEQAWRALANENAATARETVWRLIANPQGIAADLKTRVQLVDVARINKLINDLDSEDYDSREAATRELEKQGRWLEGRLHEALVNPPSLEYKRRVEQLLEKLHVPGSLSLRQEQLRLRRAMMVLEYLADDAAVDLLTRLSKQAPEEAFRQEAQVTLQRLGR